MPKRAACSAFGQGNAGQSGSSRKTGKHRIGSLDHQAAQAADESLLPGPQTAADIHDWIGDLVGRFMLRDVGGRRLDLLLQHLSRGVLGTSDFSGWDSQAEATRLLKIGLEDKLGLKLRNGFVWLRSSDHAESPQRATLKAISRGSGSHMCVLGDINDHVDPCILKLLDAAQPFEHDNDEEKVAGYNTQFEIMMTSSIAFQKSRWAWCHMHERCCPVNLLGALSYQPLRHGSLEHCDVADGRAAEQPSQVPWWKIALDNMKKGSECADMDEVTREHAFLKSVIACGFDQPACHGDGDGLDSAMDDPRPWMCTWGSTACTAYTPIGTRRAAADCTERPHNIFVSERRHRALNGSEDFYFHENSEYYPINQKQEIPLSETHDLVHIKSSGVALGFPYNRPRSFAFGFDKRKFAWAGSADPQEEFDSIFRRSLQMTGDVYFIACDPDVNSEYIAMAKQRKHSLPHGFSYDDLEVLTKVCPPGTVDRYLEWAELKRSKQSLSGVFIADLDHHPTGKGPTAGSSFPSMITHGTQFSYSQRRLHLGLEAFAVHGLCMYDQQCGQDLRKMCPFRNVFAAMPRAKQEVLVGNSLFCPLVTAWVMFCLGNLMPRTSSVPQAIVTEESEEEEEVLFCSK